MSDMSAREMKVIDGSTRSRLLGVKLAALVAEHLDTAVTSEPSALPNGAALLVDDVAWVLLDGDASRSLGVALAWAVRRGASSLNVIAGVAAGVVVRRAARFDLPISVWIADVRTLRAASATALHAPPDPRPEHLELASMIETAGAVTNIEHGVVCGEVRGLEVCRVVDQATLGFFLEPGDAAPGGETGLQLEVGVGANDREAFRLLHGDIPTIEALSSVVAAVAKHRTADARQHPLNRLGHERFLRWRAQEDPAIIGLAELHSTQPPVPRPNLKDATPCVAAGADTDGMVVTVVFSSGVDVDLIPFVADVQEMTDGRILIVAPERDLVPITREMAALLAVPVDLVAIA